MLNSNVVNLFGNRSFNTPVAQTSNIVAPIQHQQIERVINPDIEETIKAECKYKDFTTFNIIEESIYTVSADDRINQIPKKKALFVEDKCINIVGDKYKIVQPNDVIQAFQNSTGLTVDKILTNKNTGGLLLKSTLANPYLNGDEHKIDLTFYTGHNGQYRTFLSLQALRIACMNQLPAMNANKSLWLMNEKHYQSFSFDKLQKIIETLPLHMANFTNDYSKLIDIKITKKEFLELFVEQYKIQSNTKAGDKVIQSMSDLYSNAQGQNTITNDSAYKAYQAITFNNTHNGRNTANKIERDNITNILDSQKWFNELLKTA